MLDLSSHLYGNPHSHNPSSQLSTDAIDGVRELILRHFNTDSSHYDIIFTSGCTAALKLLAEEFPWRGTNSCMSCRKDDDREKTESAVKLSHDKESRDHGQTSLDTYGQTSVDSSGQTGLTTYYDNGKPTKAHSSRKTHHADVVYIPDTGEEGDSPTLSGQDDVSVFCYLEDNHTSVVGMRELASQCGAKVVCATAGNVRKASPAEQDPSRGRTTSHLEQNGPLFHLFAYPAQSNFSGRKYPLSWSEDLSTGDAYISGLEAVPGTWMVVLDAASYVCTSPLDLTANPAHFVTLSFYKMFGYPTGLGALLVRSDCAHLLQKHYYGGGTVLATVSRTGLHVPRPQLHER